ncbi:carboxy-terminal processing protease [Treponema sp. R8-4-B8]
MKIIFKFLILPLFAILSACQLFLGQDPDISPKEVIKSLWNDFNTIHANLDFRMCSNTKYNSWYDVYYNEPNGYAYKINPNMSDESLFNVCANMLKELNDPHVGLFAPGKFVGSYYDSYNEDFNLSTVKSYLIENGNSEYKNFLYGRFLKKPDIGYIYIALFTDEEFEQDDHEWGRAIDNILHSLASVNAIVLDVRNNRGGEIFIMEYIASHFASEQKDYMKARMKTGPGPNDLSAPKIYTIRPFSTVSGNMYNYTKPVVLLTNRNSVSAAEWFAMALRTQSNVTHTGTPTCGALSSRKDRSMINGWYYSISPERVTDMDGNYYEGIGISPYEEHIIANKTGDEQLDYAIELAVNAK